MTAGLGVVIHSVVALKCDFVSVLLISLIEGLPTHSGSGPLVVVSRELWVNKCANRSGNTETTRFNLLHSNRMVVA